MNVLFLIFSCYQISEALGCEIPGLSKTRVFDNFDDYRKNKITFRPSKDGWQGSSVEFSTSTISILPKDAFVTYDSESIITLKLSGKQIEAIEDGAFSSLLCLHELFLDHNNVTKIWRNIFPNRLRKLDLSHNQIEVLNNSTFANLFRLRSLDLGNNRIRSVEVLAFINLTVLEFLNLENNQIRRVPDDLFRPLPSLTTLVLSWNGLGDILGEKWGLLGKLQNLELAGIDLNHFDPTHFPFIHLKSVNLSSNSLTKLDVAELKRHFPSLELIDLSNNPWICDDLGRIIRELNDSMIKVPSGLACGEVLTPPTKPSINRVSTATTTKTSGVCVDGDELERYVQKKIKENNEELKSIIASVRTFAILTFSLLWVFIIAEVLYRANVVGIVCNRRRRSEASAQDHNDEKDFRLLHMKES